METLLSPSFLVTVAVMSQMRKIKINSTSTYQFYFDVTTATRSIQKYNITLVEGDMNARLGKKDARCDKKDARCSVYNDVTNENGKRLLDYMLECRLQSLNTR